MFTTFHIIFQKINQVVVWDKIVRRDDKKLYLHYNNINPKYYFFDDGHGLRYGHG